MNIFTVPKSVAMHENLAEEILRKFQVGKQELPDFKSDAERKIFLQHQRYNLIHLTPEGEIKITRKGEKALNYGVEKFLTREKLKERLIIDALYRKNEQKWIYFVIIPVLLILCFLLVFMNIIFFL